MIVMDVATDGVQSALEVCLIDVDKDLKELGHWTWLLAPREEDQESVPEKVRQIHTDNGLWLEALERGRPAKEVWDEVRVWVRGCNDPIYVSDNPTYDAAFSVLPRGRWIDVGTLDEMCYRFRGRRLPGGGRTYRAEDDARACLKRLRWFKSHMLSPYLQEK